MKRYFLTFASAVVGATIAMLAYNKIFQKNEYGNDIYNPMPIHKVSNNNLESPDFTTAAERSVNAVVHVKTKMQGQYYSQNSMFDFFFGNGSQQYQQPQIMPVGSGVCISSDGYIVTNNHVVNNSDYIEVVLDDKRSFTAKLIGTDATTDIALLKIDAENLPFIPYGNSDNLKIGEWVLAVGNPFNLTSTVTAGIVSAKARNINISQYSIESFIQTDAAVNPGNSGGALVNTSGELVGINTAIASQTGNYVGYSFAVPVNIVKKVVADLLEFGEVQRAYLGINIASVDQKLAAEKGISETQGVYIDDVYDNGAAAIAGIVKGDVIIGVNEFIVKDIPQLQGQLSKYRPGDKIKLGIMRGDKKLIVDVVLKNRDNGTAVVKSVDATILGAKFQSISGDDKQRLRLNSGLKVSDIGNGKLKAVGIRNGFIITSINHQSVTSIDEAKNIIEQAKGVVLVEGVYTNGMYAYFSFAL
ncbi:MAG: deoxyribonuclease HsdR [Bacteroidetes bacterium GWA2_32_17]|nr:MAG: deoxyribonuclease HsdR [Bacteroidetes bacterium GWA2_32_17]